MGESLMWNPSGRNLQQQALFWIFTKFPFHSLVANVQSERLCDCKGNNNFNNTKNYKKNIINLQSENHTYVIQTLHIKTLQI